MSLPDAARQGVGFDAAFQWDIPLLEGYQWEVAQGSDETDTKQLWPLALYIVGQLKRLQPDVILLTGWHQRSLLSYLVVAKILRIPTLVRGDSNALKPRTLIVKTFHWILVRLYSAIVYVGKANKAFFSGYGIPDDRLFSVPHFVDNDRFSDAARKLDRTRVEIRKSWDIPGEAICFLFAGKFVKKKRLMDFLEAFLLLSGRHSGVHALIVGSGPQRLEAQEFVNRYGLAITFAGFLNQTEIPRAYLASDCLVLPSDYGETWGLVVNEAMACGKPAIVSDRVGCGPDLVENGITGYRFACGDIHALANWMLKMATDPEAMREMGQRAKSRVLESYSVEKAVEGTLQAVNYVLGRRS